MRLVSATNRPPSEALKQDVCASCGGGRWGGGGGGAHAGGIEAMPLQAKRNVSRAARGLGPKNKYVLYRSMKRYGIGAEKDDPTQP